MFYVAQHYWYLNCINCFYLTKNSQNQQILISHPDCSLFEEVELQISRYYCYLDRVQNTAKNWIQFDFLSAQTLSANELAKLNQKGQFNDIKNTKNIQSSVNQQEDRKGVYQSEIALRINVIKQTDVNFPDNNKEEIRKIFSSSLNILKTYIIDMSHYVSNLSNLANDEEAQMNTVLQQNLCDIYNKEVQCSDTSSTQKIF
ncbi:hypothetical protein ABPG72_020314 [Tetrahymena utriculariae]